MIAARGRLFMSRRKAREVALQSLFQLDFNVMEESIAIDAVMEESDRLSGNAKAYAEKIVEGVRAHLAEIDVIITAHSTEWKVGRMPGVDRNITRMAVYELKFGDEMLTPNIIINEAVELAKIFGTDDSPRFVNGILGSMIKKD